MLLVDTDLTAPKKAPAIEWRGNLGHLSLGSQAVEVVVTPEREPMFTLQGAADEK